tara:strand:+ start:1339 stop:2343 length:1005 start_codon:yes stop_codon:yes gene_type:complete
MERENFINILENQKKKDINNKYNNFFNSLAEDIKKIPNILFYGPPGTGKYSESLKLIEKYSPSGLKYEKKMYINSIKNEHIIKISDIHYEINMENLTCNSKQLFNDIYINIIDCIESSYNKNGIILFKNFHYIDYELLDIFYSYIQKTINSNIIIKYIIITENISFIPENIVNLFKILYYSKFSFTNYIKLSNVKNKTILLKMQKTQESENINKMIENIDNIALLKFYHLNDNNEFINKKYSICDNLVNIIIDKNIDYFLIRNTLYDLLIYNQNIHDSIFYILSNVIKQHKNVPKTFLDNIYLKLCEFFKYYNNNYRPIFHLESLILTIIKELE